MLKEYGYVRVGSISNKIELANVDSNVNEILSCLDKAKEKGIEIVSFPELSLTGSSLKDLFYNDDLIDDVMKGLEVLTKESVKYDLIFIVGAPLRVNRKLYNCAFSISNGKVIGISVKSNLTSEEKKYFSDGRYLEESYIDLNGSVVAISPSLLYVCDNHDFLTYGVEFSNDLNSVYPTSSELCLNGANLIFNLASNKTYVNEKEETIELIKNQARKCKCVYVYSSLGVSESSSEGTYNNLLAIVSDELVRDETFSFDSKMIYDDVDLKRVNNERLKDSLWEYNDELHEEVFFSLSKKENALEKKYCKYPFLMSEKGLEEIISIQAYSLAKRVKHLGNSKMVIGISGGSDSTLAFLVCLRVVKILNMKNEDIICVTMPGFGTSSKTLNNSLNLMRETGVTLKEISIKEACTIHYKDIEHDMNNFDITYENAQARERTQILFDLANKYNGIVIGTGDLSELILGWCTYNGDHMSNYGVNAGIPKTLVKALIRYEASNYKGVMKDTLLDILDTVISPELLPLDKKGNIAQSSENSLGSYTLHDFFIYHFLTYNLTLKKLYFITKETFKDEFSEEEIKNTLKTFTKRFFTQQFKRNCTPDGIRVLNIDNPSLVSDLYSKAYLKEIGEL